MEIQFLGATQTVTGSKYLVKSGQANVLIDCGLFQGYKKLRLCNWNALPVNPADIDTVLLTHAHIDHSGYIPLLVKNGFKGKILCTQATLDLCEILLRDSGHLHEEEARYANRKGYSKHSPALPLYTLDDAEASLAHFEAIQFEETIKLGDGLEAQFFYGGHILGASMIRVADKSTSILFSGDLGRPNDPIMYPPSLPPKADYYVVESTYGDRLHSEVDPEKELDDIINRTVKRGGTILIPSFAVGRAQLMLYYIHQLKAQKRIPDIPVFVDSPMATDVTKLFYHHSNQHQLSREQSAAVCHTASYSHSVDESKALDENRVPIIIISASGMATGGRILHHLRHYAPDHRNTIVFSGFQAGGTRGDRIVRGESEVKMFGQMVPIRAEVVQLDNTSAHADYEDVLAWLKHIDHKPKNVFITHGEETAANALWQRIVDTFHWPCVVPSYCDKFNLD